jgi:bacillithiol system protein YtxJ
MGLFDTVKDAFSDSTTGDIWDTITDLSQVDIIVEESENRPQLIYKHSHRCSVCFVARGNLESASQDILEHADMHFLNVVHNRDSSDRIASKLNVRHESPQVILIDNEEVVLHASHGSIDADKILDMIR